MRRVWHTRWEPDKLAQLVDNALNNVIEQDHRTVKRVVRPMLDFKSFWAAQRTLAGIEVMHMLKKEQMVMEEGEPCLTPAEQFYALAA
jgi:putative transposase